MRQRAGRPHESPTSRIFLCAFAALLCLGPTVLWSGEPRQIRAAWGELGPLIENHKVALVLPDGTHIEGKARDVERDSLRIRVSKTSNRKAVAKGEQAIPRPSVSLLRVTTYRKLGRILATTATLGVAAAVVAAKYPDLYEGSVLVIVPCVVAGGMAGLTVAGYYTGKRLDRGVTEIRIVPDESKAGP